MKQIVAIVEYDASSVKREIASAWKNYKQTEKYGLKFGEICFEWQHKLKTQGGIGNKGKGIVPMLEQLKIPISTAYWWIDRYKESIGLKEKKEEKQESTVARFDRVQEFLEKLYRGAPESEREKEFDALIALIEKWKSTMAVVGPNGQIIPASKENKNG